MNTIILTATLKTDHKNHIEQLYRNTKNGEVFGWYRESGLRAITHDLYNRLFNSEYKLTTN